MRVAHEGDEVRAGVTLTAVVCWNCTGVYAISERRRADVARSGGTWYCPYCKGATGYDETKEQQLRREVDAERRERRYAEERADRARADAEHHKNRARAQKAAKTRIKNRVANGVCPCCNRTFQNLQKHMQNQHPDYVETK